MRALRRNALGHFLPRRRRNGTKGAAKSGALGAAILRRHKVIYRRGYMTPAELNRLGATEAAYYRHARVMGRRARRGNPGPKGAAKMVALDRAQARAWRRAYAAGGIERPGPISVQIREQALRTAAKRRRRVLRRNPRDARGRFLRRRRRRNPLAGFSAVNPKRKAKHMARRRRRSAAQRAAFRRMIAGLRRHRSGSSSKRRRRRNPRTKGAPMARRKRRRARRVAVMVNPRRRRRRSRSLVRRSAPRRRRGRRIHHRRRRNPGMGGGIKGALRSAFMVGIPSIGAGFVSNFIDAKFLSDKHVVIRMGAKLAEAVAVGLAFRNRPMIACASMGAILGSIGGEFGVRAAGGVIVGSSPVSKGQGAAALITEDPRAMGVLVTTMQGMGYQIDQNVSLGDYSALPSGSYQDVNLG